MLSQALIARAGLLVIATPYTFHVRKIVEIARALNPTIETVVRTLNEEEAELLNNVKVAKVFLG